MPTFPAGELVTLLSHTVSGRNSDGNDVFTLVPVPILGCAFDPGGSTEVTATGDVVTTQPTVYLPDGMQMPAAVDQVIARGVTYDVDGTPAQYVNPFTGYMPGPVVKLKAVTG